MIKIKNSITTINILLFLLGLVLYFYRTSDYFITHDTGSMLLNSLCLAKQGTDEYGVTFPLSWRSFDVHGGIVFLYLSGLVFKFIDGSYENLALISVLFGFFSTVIITILFFFLAEDKRKIQYYFGIFYFFLITSPFYLVFHRNSTDHTPVVFFISLFLLFSYFFYKSSHAIFPILLGLTIGILPHVYHGTRLLFLLTYPSIIFSYYFANKGSKSLLDRVFIKKIFLSILVSAPFILPFLFDFLGPRIYMQRLNIILNERVLSNFELIQSFIVSYFSSLNVNFLFINGDPIRFLHHGIGGEISIFFLPLWVIGNFILINKFKINQDPFIILLLLSQFLFFLPAGLGFIDHGYISRMAGGFVPIIVICFAGLEYLVVNCWPSIKQKLFLLTSGGVFVMICFIISLYSSYYFYERASKWKNSLDPVAVSRMVDFQSHTMNPATLKNHLGNTLFTRVYFVMNDKMEYCQ